MPISDGSICFGFSTFFRLIVVISLTIVINVQILLQMDTAAHLYFPANFLLSIGKNGFSVFNIFPSFRCFPPPSVVWKGFAQC